MEHSPNRGDKREFHCIRCQGRILIPWDLPATTGPCPYCGEVITSPPPIEPVPWPQPEVIQSPPAVVEKAIVEPTPLPAPKPVETAVKPMKPTRPMRERDEERPKLGKDWLPIAGFFLLLAVGAGIAIYLGTREIKRPASKETPLESVDELMVRENRYIQTGWRDDARRLLAGFIAADSVSGKLPFILGGESMKPRLEAFYGSGPIDDSDTPVGSFAVQELLEEDRRRGMFMMTFDQPPQINMREFFQPLATLEVQFGLEEADMLLSSAAITRNFAMEPLRVHAFFKRTPDGLKLDWEVFAQTKYQTFRKFIDARESGPQVFRVLIMEDVPDVSRPDPGKHYYLMADPAHKTHTARVAVASDSPIGRILSEIHWRGKLGAKPLARTATLELSWTGEADTRTLEITRFLCWEFLGLGGVEANSPQNAE